jgi:mannosylglycerate hydrolase MGH1-like protein
LPTGGSLEQADGTAWMAFYCTTMLSIALELASEDPVYEDLASKFFEHFVAITDAMNSLGGDGLWDEHDGFYYDQLRVDGRQFPLRIRSAVGIIPLFAVEVLRNEVIARLPGFSKRLHWFLENRRELAQHIAQLSTLDESVHTHRLLAIATRHRLERVLRYVLDEREFLSPYGIRSLSKAHQDKPFIFTVNGEPHRVEYVPGESDTGLFGGNSNWRGPIWFPTNYLLIEALERYHHFYGDGLRVEFPTGSGRAINLKQVAHELTLRLTRLFLRDANGKIPSLGDNARFVHDPHWRDLVLFHEYFHGDTGRGLGANHQTGWTALATRCLEDVGRHRASHEVMADNAFTPSSA